MTRSESYEKLLCRRRSATSRAEELDPRGAGPALSLGKHLEYFMGY